MKTTHNPDEATDPANAMSMEFCGGQSYGDVRICYGLLRQSPRFMKNQ